MSDSMSTSEDDHQEIDAGDEELDQGPFSDEEFSLIIEVKGEGRRWVDREGVEKLFAGLKTHPDLQRRIYKAFKLTKPKKTAAVEGFTFSELFTAVCSCSRASAKSIARTFYRIVDEEASNAIPCFRVSDLFHMAYEMIRHVSPTTAEPSPPYDAFRPSLYRRAFRKSRGQDYASQLTGDVLQRWPTILADDDLMEAMQAVANSRDEDVGEMAVEHLQSWSSFTDEEQALNFEEFFEWAAEAVPLLYRCLGAFVYSRICPSQPLPPQLDFTLPRLRHPSLIIHHPDQLFGLATAAAACQGEWERLYSSQENGLSFSRIAYYVLNYTGPTVMLMRDTGGTIFGFYTAEPWRESNTFYGSYDCFLFRLDPYFNVYRPKFNSDYHFQYFNTKGGYGGIQVGELPRGFGVGGDLPSDMRIFINQDLDICMAAQSCTTFESGPLATRPVFNLQTLEVWGVGGEDVILEATTAHALSRVIVSENMAKAAKVDKRAFVDNDFDREMLLPKTFSGGSVQSERRDGGV